MAGFLDKNTRVVDMVLTDYGKELYSKGELKFKYYAFSDDGVDYDPYISNSASLSTTELTASKVEQIEATLVREATFGLQKSTNFDGRDQTNVKNLLFTMPQGQKILPLMLMTPDLISGSIRTKQQLLQDVYVNLNSIGGVTSKIGPFDRGFNKPSGTRLEFDLNIEDFFERSSMEGYHIRVFTSGSDGLVEVVPKRDLKNVLSYQHDLRLFRDSEVKGIIELESKQIKEFEESVGFNRVKE